MKKPDSYPPDPHSPDPHQHDSEALFRIRHSLAHLMAEAVMELRPGTKLGFGPPIEDGFYYDFILSSPLTETDFPEIEKRMRQLIRQGDPFVREDLCKQDALDRLNQMGEPYKREYAEELFERKGIQKLSFYYTGSFLDMCEGPHVETTHQLPLDAFQLRSLAGAYWRGNSKNAMMTRIYAWAFLTKAELDAHVKAFQLAQERDHKNMGKALSLFEIDDLIGQGLPLWLPNGTVVREELEKFIKELEFKAGYQRVVTPHLAKVDLYYQTGHLPYYADHMYPFLKLQDKEEVYCLKPMNCPHHHRIYASRIRSYRDLPLRLAEYGQVYRLEDSGALSGLLRVRGMCQNDAHIYCTPDQIQSEFLSVMNLIREAYTLLGIQSYYIRFSTWDPEDPKSADKYVQRPEAWEWSQKKIHEALLESGLPFVEGKGEAAFYGPKLDVQLKTVTGREETASTNQLDFAISERLMLRYIGADNQEHNPYIIHRAPLGSHERFVAFLIELYGGAFPTWLAPVQVKILTVSDQWIEYAEKVHQQLRSHWIRSELIHSADTVAKKIKKATQQKIPHLLIIGEREQANQTVTWRQYAHTEQQTLGINEFQTILLNKIQNRTLK